jgi:hypothetical protein
MSRELADCPTPELLVYREYVVWGQEQLDKIKFDKLAEDPVDIKDINETYAMGVELLKEIDFILKGRGDASLYPGS